MSNWLKYYDEEMKIFSKWQNRKITTDIATKAIRRLQRHYKLLPIEIDYGSGENGWSWAISANFMHNNKLHLNQDRLNWLLVAHELAHLLLDHRRLRGFEPPGRDHGPAHRALVEDILNYVDTKQWHRGRLSAPKINRYTANKEAA
jgi:predicted SprT family Zn-dependent metalloprotease